MPYSAAAIFTGHLQGPGESVGFLCCRLIEIVFSFVICFPFIFRLVSPGTVSDADRRVRSGPPGHGSSFGVVPLPGDIPRSRRHPWTYTGDPSSITLPHNEGGLSKNNKWGAFAWMVLVLSAPFLALGILQSVDISSKNHGDLPKRRGQCSAVSFWMIEFPSECTGMIRCLLCGCVPAYRLSSH